MSELGVGDRQAEGEMGQGVGWLGSETDRRLCMECRVWTGQVARCSVLRKEGYDTRTEGNEGRNVRQLIHCGRCLYIGELG